MIRLVLSVIFCILSVHHHDAQTLKISDNGLSAGYMTLSWTPQEGKSVSIEKRSNDQWNSIYEGLDSATTLSGLSDGIYEFRARFSDGSFSEILKLEVKHHTLEKAFSFFGLGALMFVILLLMIANGARSGQFVESEQS